MSYLRRLPLVVVMLLAAASFAGYSALTRAQETPTGDPFATVNARITELAQTPNLNATANANATASAQSPTADPFATVNSRATENATLYPSNTPTAEPPAETSAAPAVQTLSIVPDEGPSGTTYIVTGTGLTPGKEYRIVVVYREDNATVFDGPLAASDTGEVVLPLVSERSDPPGVYDVFLYDGETVIGVSALEINVAELSADQVVGTLSPGQPVRGDLTFDERVETYAFEGQQGDIVTIDLRSETFDAFVLLSGSNGVVLTRNDNGGGGENARITTFTLPTTDTYLVGVTSRDAAETGGRRTVQGAYTLIVRFARFAQNGPIEGGETVVGELSPDVQIAEYTFQANAGAVVTIDLGSEDFDPLLRLRAPGGREIATDDDGGPGLYARIDRFSIAEAGEYTIVVDGNRGFTGQRVISGQFAVTLNFEGEEVDVVTQPQVTPTAGTSALTSEDVMVLPINVGDTLTGELTAAAQRVLYTFTGRAGDVISIALDSEAFDATVILLDSNGNELTRDDDGGSGLNALINSFTIPADGEYGILVDGYRGVQNDRELLGQFTISLTSGASVAQAATPTLTPAAPAASPTAGSAQASATPASAAASPTPLPTLPPAGPPGTITHGQTLSGEFTAEVQNASYTFTGTAGESVTILLTAETFDPYLRLLDADGVELTSDDDGGGGLNARISNFILPTSGEYTIVVDAYRGVEGERSVLGTYNLSLEISPAGVVQATPTYTPEPTAEQATAVAATQEPPTTEPPTAVPTTVEQPTATPLQPQVTATATVAPPTSVPPSATPLPGAAPTLRPGAIPTPQPLGFDQVLSGTFTGAADEQLTFRFAAVAGDIVTISTNSNNTIDTSMELIGPNNETLASDDDGGISFDPELQALKLPDTGEYVVVLRPYNPGDKGTIELTLKLLSPAMLDAESQILQINSKNPTQTLLFSGNEGETIRLTIRSISQVTGEPSFTVTQGDKLLASNPVGTNLRLSFDFIVEEDGPVLVTVTGGENGSAVVEVSVERVPK